jgi:hypothetical protein
VRWPLQHLAEEKYSDFGEKHGVPWTGMENAPADVQALAKPKMVPEKLPFEPDMDPDVGGQAAINANQPSRRQARRESTRPRFTYHLNLNR